MIKCECGKIAMYVLTKDNISSNLCNECLVTKFNMHTNFSELTVDSIKPPVLYEVLSKL